MKNCVINAVLLVGITLIFSCKKDESAPTPEKYFPTVKTIIESNCLSCHSSTGSWEGRPIAFDTDAEITAGYAAIKAAVADPASPGPFGNKRMPPAATLSASDIDSIVKWFDKGGKATD